jgi:hypothetical protein
MSTVKPKLPPTWRVEVAAHEVARWRIAACAFEFPAADADDAALTAIRWAHRDAGAPPWKPYVRESLPYAKASRKGEVEPIEPPCGQLELGIARAA